MRKMLNSKWSFVIMVAAWILLLWYRTFAGLVNGDGNTTIFSIIGTSVLAVGGTLFYGLIVLCWKEDIPLFEEDEDEEDESAEEAGTEVSDDFDELCEEICRHNSDCHSEGLRNSLCMVLILAGFCLFSVVTSEWCGWIDLFNDSKYMEIGSWCINKKNWFDIITMIIFPIWTTFILRKVKERRFEVDAVVSAIVQILVLSLMGFMLYMQLGKIYPIWMGCMHFVTLAAIVRGYLWKDIRKKGNAVALLIGYALFYILLLATFHFSGQTLTFFLTGDADYYSDVPFSYISNVEKIAENASFIGQSSALTAEPYVLSFMDGRVNLVLTSLFYGGWLPTIALIILQIIFVVAAASVVLRNKQKDGLDVMFLMAWVTLLFSCVGGILYAFGSPLRVVSPFSGSVGIVADSIALGLIMLCCLTRRFGTWFEGLYLDDYDEEDDEDEDEND